jgi:pantetheine-phosphate adenylyltransferase
VTATAPLTAVYPGTFDPMTLGHEDLMRRASRLFDRLVLAVAAGHHKRTMFTIAERLDMAREIAKPYPNIEVMAFRGLLSQFVGEVGGKVVVRGLRAVSDFEYEFQMAGMNRQLMPEVETVFMTPGDHYQFVSGTFVREIVVKPIPFITVAVRQEFEVECPVVDECQLSRAEFIKQ